MRPVRKPRVRLPSSLLNSRGSHGLVSVACFAKLTTLVIPDLARRSSLDKTGYISFWVSGGRGKVYPIHFFNIPLDFWLRLLQELGERGNRWGGDWCSTVWRMSDMNCIQCSTGWATYRFGIDVSQLLWPNLLNVYRFPMVQISANPAPTGSGFATRLNIGEDSGFREDGVDVKARRGKYQPAESLATKCIRDRRRI